jgi:hypothetical protein
MKLEIPSSCSSLAVTRNTNRVDPEGGDDPLNQEVYDLLWLLLPDELTRGRMSTPGFLSPVPIMPYIAIPGILFLRDIID